MSLGSITTTCNNVPKVLAEQPILLIEPQEADTPLQTTLQERGYQVDRASTAEAAQEALTNVRYLLILFDIDSFPGIDALSYARKICETEEIPLIFLSDDSNRRRMEEAEAISPYGFISKKSDISAIENALKMAVRLAQAQHRLQRSLRPASPENGEDQLGLAQEIIDRAPEMIFIKDNRGRFSFMNRRMVELLGNDTERFAEEIDAAFVDDTDTVTAAPLTLKDGTTRWYRTRQIQINRARLPLYTVGYGTDITDVRRTEERIHHLDSLLQAMRTNTRLLFNAGTVQELIEDICRNLASHHGYHSAWIILYDADGAVIHAAESGVGEGLDQLWASFRRGKLPHCVEKVLPHDGIYIEEEPAKSCGDCPLAKMYGDRAAMTARLEYEGNVFGFFSISVPKLFVQGDEEQAIFQETALDISFTIHRIQVEMELRRLSQIVSTVPHPMSLISPDYRYLVVNDIYARLHGVDKQELIGSSVKDLIDSKLVETEIKPHIDRCLEGETVRYEVEIDFPHVGRRWMLMEYFPFYNEYGKAEGVVTHGFDITERKTNELFNAITVRIQTLMLHGSDTKKTLKEIIGIIREELDLEVVAIRLKQEERFPYYVIQAPPSVSTETGECNICSRDEEGNLRYRCMCGAVLSERGDPSLPFFSEYGSFWTASRSRLRRDYALDDFEGASPRLGGPLGYETIGLIPLYNAQGIIGLLQLSDERRDRLNQETLTHLESIARYIGLGIEKLQTHALIKRSEKQFRHLIERLPGVICAFSEDNRITYWNHAAEEVSGYTREESMADPEILSALFPGDSFADTLLAKYRQGDPGLVREEVTFTSKEKERKTLLVSTWENAYDFSGQKTWVIAIDITEQKRAGQAIQKLLDEKQTLLTEVHHRIKNNMNTINALLNLQSSTVKDEAAKEALMVASSRVSSMMVLYNKLYRNSSLDEVALDDYLQGLLEEIIGNYSFSVEVQEELASIVIPVKGAANIGIVVNEIITNMMKYAFQADRENILSIDAALRGTTLEIIVADNGPGFDPEKIEPGFGMELIEAITRQLGGSLEIKNRGGAQFKLEIPYPEQG